MTDPPLDDLARFYPNDDDPLVAAAFACPTCLRTPRFVRLGGGGSEPRAHCRCPGCRLDWTIALNAPQTLRLGFDPPAPLAVGRDDSEATT